MSNVIQFNGNSGVSTYVRPMPARTLAESLLSEKELLKRELDELLQQPVSQITSVSIDRITSIVSYLLDDFLARIDDSYQLNTAKSLRQNWSYFYRWCGENKRTPLPATAAVFNDFIDAVGNELSIQTLEAYRWAVSSIHTEIGLPDPTKQAEAIEKLGKAKDTKVQSGKANQRQASPLRYEHLMLIQDTWGKSDILRDLRDAAILSLAFEGLLRESELARIVVSHVYATHEEEARLLVPYTKTDKSGEGSVKPIGEETYTLLCRYFDMAKLGDNDYVLSKINRTSNRVSRQLKPMTGKSVDRIYARAHAFVKTKMNVPRQVWTGHSCRVGAAQSLLAKGYSTPQIQQAGGWKSPVMVMRYGKDILANESAMASMMKKKS